VTETAVAARDVSKKFRLFKEHNHSLKATVLRGRRIDAEDFWALEDVTFEVPAGETFGLIGENGSGKSTMLKCLTRILRPDRGTVEVNGKVSALLELGAGFHPELTGRENVYLNGAILGLSQKELRRRFDTIVDFAGIGKFIEEPVKNYSSGMYVRLGFSIAINVDPDVLLVDEVLAVGDEAFQRRCGEKFAELKAAGKTIILVSHAMVSVQNICDRVAWFEHGRLQDIGEPKEVIEKYTGGVQVDRQTDEDGHNRWGSGELRIERVELLDAFGRPATKLISGSKATIRLHYEADGPVEKPVFAAYIATVVGHPVTGPNTKDAGIVPDKLDGSGVVDIEFDELRLLPGTYDLTVVACDVSMLKEYDHRQNVARFDVERGAIREYWGVTSLSPRWRMDAKSL
jgi:ABC-type polysaccharide/polyol phosphate transport system ATPase subunit